ncbi:MAG: aminoacyl-histidine dipeptidase, partial [Lachnospiraceae bacterium]|nr:aminoacyl-histidine dipeptidase [Lachnospiraceae bacterium]
MERRLAGFEPERVLYYFEELCRIPHGSGNCGEISDYCVKFAKERGLRYVQEECGNVIIFKPGTAGYEEAPAVILQGHLDMVAEQTPGSAHDFMKDPLDLFVEEGWIGAKDTTLGGDDGIAI